MYKPKLRKTFNKMNKKEKETQIKLMKRQSISKITPRIEKMQISRAKRYQPLFIPPYH